MTITFPTPGVRALYNPLPLGVGMDGPYGYSGMSPPWLLTYETQVRAQVPDIFQLTVRNQAVMFREGHITIT